MAPKDTVYVANEDNVCSSSASANLEFGEANLKAIAEVFSNEGDEALIKGDYQNSVQFSTEGINVNCTDKEVNAKLYGNRATANYHLGCYSEALEDAKAARQYKPSYFKALITGAEALLALNLCKEAITWCDEGLKFHPENPGLLKLKNEVDAKKSQQLSFQKADIEAALASKPPLQNEVNAKKIQKLSVKKEVVEAAMASKEDKLQCQMEYSALNLDIAKKVGSKRKVGTQYLILGDRYFQLGDFEKAINYYKQFLSCFKEGEDCIGEWHAYSKLGDAYNSVGMVNQAVGFYELCLTIAREVGDKKGEIQVYCRLGGVFQFLADFEKAIGYQELRLSLALKLGDVSEQGCAYGKLGSGYHSLGDLERAVQYYEKHIKIIDKVGDRNGLVKAYGNLGRVYHSLQEFKVAIEYHERQLSIAKTEGRRADEARANYELGRNFEAIESLAEATQYYRSTAVLFEEMRAHLPCKKVSFFQDEWKINFFEVYQCVSMALCRTLLKQNKVSEALIAVESGRAQSLVDILKSRYGISSSELPSPTQEAVMHDVLRGISTNTVVLRLDGDKIYIWLLLPGKTGREAQFVRRTIDGYQDVKTFWKAMGGTRSDTLSSLCLIYRLVFDGISDFLQGEELLIVPDGPLYYVPFAALRDSIQSKYLCELFRIRLFPSLTSMKIISDSRDYHFDSGALLVGDPSNEEFLFHGRPHRLSPLPFARKEVNLIGRLTGIKPLIGKEATKREVLRHLNSVALIHIAAHGEMESGEICLAIGETSSDVSKAEDCMLTMAEVLNVGVRARLVVLSCCHSGRGKVTSEGIVGIARAFLAAGARSVLVSPWAIDDEGTLSLMSEFYKELVTGSTAGKALNKAMECQRSLPQYCELRHWATFVLIGDDVTLEMFSKPEQDLMPDADVGQCR